MEADPDLLDLAEHLSYHGTVGYAECRELELPDPAKAWRAKPEPSGRTDGDDVEFTVEHRGVEYLVTVERVRKS